jgi:hypothetical protein
MTLRLSFHEFGLADSLLRVRIHRAYQMRRRRRIWTAFIVLAGSSLVLDCFVEIPSHSSLCIVTVGVPPLGIDFA